MKEHPSTKDDPNVAPGGDGSLRYRIEELEWQVKDLQNTLRLTVDRLDLVGQTMVTAVGIPLTADKR